MGYSRLKKTPTHVRRRCTAQFHEDGLLLKAFEARDQLEATLVHTGQHCDANSSVVFFEELEMKRPDISLEVGLGKHGQ